jgi:hypothetical protein
LNPKWVVLPLLLLSLLVGSVGGGGGDEDEEEEEDRARRCACGGEGATEEEAGRLLMLLVLVVLVVLVLATRRRTLRPVRLDRALAMMAVSVSVWRGAGGVWKRKGRVSDAGMRADEEKGSSYVRTQTQRPRAGSYTRRVSASTQTPDTQTPRVRGNELSKPRQYNNEANF